jgi:hypothetical protein
MPPERTVSSPERSPEQNGLSSRHKDVILVQKETGCASPRLVRARDQIGEDRGLHLALQPAHIRLTAGDGGCKYSDCCTTDGTSYNTSDDAVRALAPEHNQGAVERLVSPQEEVVTKLATTSFAE